MWSKVKGVIFGKYFHVAFDVRSGTGVNARKEWRLWYSHVPTNTVYLDIQMQLTRTIPKNNAVRWMIDSRNVRPISKNNHLRLGSYFRTNQYTHRVHSKGKHSCWRKEIQTNKCAKCQKCNFYRKQEKSLNISWILKRILDAECRISVFTQSS